MASGNPMLSERSLRGLPWQRGEGAMTVEGATNKAMLLTALLVVGAGVTWNQVFHGGNPSGLMMLGIFGGLILALITSFKPTVAMYTAPAYAVAEGLALGGISALMEQRFPGIAMQAVGITMATLVAFLVAYRAGVIRASDRMRRVLMAATFGIMLMYLANLVMHMFGTGLPFLSGSGPIAIGINLLIAGVAAFNLVLDFDFIEQGARQGAPKYMEWYGAFGLLVTLVWLYIEVLRLLTRLQDRR